MSAQSKSLITTATRLAGIVSANRFVSCNGTQAVAGEKCLGVASMPEQAGRTVPVTVQGTAIVQSGGVFAVGDPLMSDADGQAVKASSPAAIAAMAIEAATTAGQLVEVLLIPNADRPLPTPPSQKQIGAQIVDWASVATANPAGTTGTQTEFTRGASLGYSITVTGSGGRIRAGAAGAPLGITGIRQIGMFLHNPQPVARALSVYLTNVVDSYTNFSIAIIAVRPGWGFYTLNRGAFDLGKTGTGFDWTAALAQMQLTTTINGAGDTSAFQLGEELQIGGIFMNPSVGAKAKFCLWSDDGKNSNIIPGATAITGGDGVPRKHSIASLVASYGMSYSAGIIFNLLGQANYLTVDQMLALQDMGVMIGNHCNTFGSASVVAGAQTGDGLRVLGPYGYALAPAGEKLLSFGTVKNDNSLIKSELQQCYENLDALGVSTAGHIVLPEGGFDQHVSDAIDSLPWARSVRSIGSGRINNLWTAYTFKNASSNGQMWKGKTHFYAGGIQLDNPATAATAAIQAYVNEVELSGGVGCAFMHDFNHADLGGGLYSDTALNTLLAYLATKTATIDVVTPEQLWAELPRPMIF